MTSIEALFDADAIGADLLLQLPGLPEQRLEPFGSEQPVGLRSTAAPEKFAQAVYTFVPGLSGTRSNQSEAKAVPAGSEQGAGQICGGPDRIRSLVRENVRLAFLNSLLTRIGGHLEVPSILSGLSSVLADFSIKAQPSLILWERSGSEIARSEAFLPQGLGQRQRDILHELTQSGQDLMHRHLGHIQLRHFEDPNGPTTLFEALSTVTKPLESGGQVFGIFRLDASACSMAIMNQGLLSCLVQQLAQQIAGAMTVSRLQRLAEFDPLTGLPNRRQFDRRLAEELKRHQRQLRPLSAIMLDLDDFKVVNDSQGHQAGDALLRHMGRFIASCIRETDIAARYGGEEFAILLPDTDEGEAEVLALRLLTRNAETGVSFEADSPSGTFSLGIACLQPGEAPDGSTLIHRADLALYSAKQSGKNTSRRYSQL